MVDYFSRNRSPESESSETQTTRSPSQQDGLTFGKERHGGSPAPLPRLLSFLPPSHEHGMKDPHLFPILAPAYLGKAGLVNMRVLGER